MTFYYHFQDIYDLVEWSCEEDARQALANNTTAETWQTGLANIMFAVRDNKLFVMNVYRCVSAERIQRLSTSLPAPACLATMASAPTLRPISVSTSP
ncbi:MULTISPECIES: hypothetical protein [unclassified Collinsella]|uniref:hypothetical protein n=1 Tax=unclassified Collinsella TaxID=2637548 RepID=UPI00319D9366